MHQQWTLQSLKSVGGIRGVGQNRLRSGIRESLAGPRWRGRRLLRRALSRPRALLPLRASANFRQVDSVVLRFSNLNQLRWMQRRQPISEHQKESEQNQLVANDRIQQPARRKVSKLERSESWDCVWIRRDQWTFIVAGDFPAQFFDGRRQVGNRFCGSHILTGFIGMSRVNIRGWRIVPSRCWRKSGIFL